MTAGFGRRCKPAWTIRDCVFPMEVMAEVESIIAEAEARIAAKPG